MNELQNQLAFVDAGLQAEPYEDQYLSRFGSHFSLRFHPDGRGVLPVGLGPINTSSCVYFSVEADGVRYVLPLAYQAVFCIDETIITDFTLSRTMNRARLTSELFPQELDVAWEFVSPFYPQDVRISTSPFFYVSCRMTNRSDKPIMVTVRGGLEKSRETRVDQDAGMVVQGLNVAAAFRPPEVKPGRLFHFEFALSGDDMIYEQLDTVVARWECLSRTITLQPGESTTVGYIFAKYLTDASVVMAFDEACSYAYQGEFASVNEVVSFAHAEQMTILRKSDLFDNLFTESSLPQHIQDFIAWNFHIFQGASWLLRGEDGRVFYTNYEGGTGYFSTIDVEFNLAPFYAMFWPQCIADQLELWARGYMLGNHNRPFTYGHAARIIPHDLGGGFELAEQVYILGPMPVEENSNYILLNYLYYQYTGDLSQFVRYRQICLELADYIIDSDLSGNGLPDVGTNNTLDCFDKLLKDSPDQVFLGLKAGCALHVLAEMLRAGGEIATAERYQAQAVKIFTAIEEEAWLGDHYAVTINPARPDGWDLPWSLTMNGLAYLLYTGQPLPLQSERVRTDLALTRHEYSIWPSMGIWRDMEACYFGMLPETEYTFRPDFRGDMYPRSFNAVMLLQAYAGIGVNLAEQQLTLARKFTGRFPLPMLADWQAEEIPWLFGETGKMEMTLNCEVTLILPQEHSTAGMRKG